MRDNKYIMFESEKMESIKEVENNSLDDVKDWIKNREESIDEESEKYAIEKEACTRVFSIVR